MSTSHEFVQDIYDHHLLGLTFKAEISGSRASVMLLSQKVQKSYLRVSKIIDKESGCSQWCIPQTCKILVLNTYIPRYTNMIIFWI